MRKCIIYLYVISIVSFTIESCCKDKRDCLGGSFTQPPFVQKFDRFTCGSSDYEYTYIFNNSKQIDSLKPICTFSTGIAFPINESNMRYMIIGRTAFHYRDTFQTTLLKDTCLKTLTYQVDMIQQDTTLNNFPGTVSIFTAVENIPADYKVEVKYKYVPLP